MRKCVVFGGIAAALAFAPVGAVCAAGDYEAPSGIELSIGDIEIDRADLSGGRLVEVPVYISNNSGFVSLEMLIELDGRLHFDEERELVTRATDMSGVHISHYQQRENTVTAKFVTPSKSRYTDDGEIGCIRVMLPEDTAVGRYDIWLSPSPDEVHMILTYNSLDSWFGPECFSQLRGGSITVKDGNSGSQGEQAAPHHEENVQRNVNAQDSGSSDNGNNDSEAAAAASTTAVTVTAETTTKTTTKTTVTSSSTSTGTASSTSEVASTETTTTDSAEPTMSAAENDNKKHKSKNLLIPVIIATVIALGTACFIVRKGGRSK